MSTKLIIEHNINFDKSIDIMVYRDEKLVEEYYDFQYSKINELIKRIREENKDAVIEQVGVGELCTGGWMRWEIDQIFE